MVTLWQIEYRIDNIVQEQLCCFSFDGHLDGIITTSTTSLLNYLALGIFDQN